MAKTQFTKAPQRISPKRLLGAIIALVVAFLLLTSVVSVAEKYSATRKHIRELAEEKEALEAKQASLQKMNDYIQTPAGSEQLLRQKYNVVKPGEGVIVVAETTPIMPREQTSKVHRWWNAILSGLGIRKD